MKTIKILSKLLAVFALLLSSFAFSQNITGKSTKITVSGTSTLHSWIMTSTNATFSGTVDGAVIKNVKFSTVAKNLKSEKGKMMDNKAYGAMKADQFPNISFTATSMNVAKGTVTGKLTVTNVTKTVTFPVTVVKKGSSYDISGTAKIKMTDYGVTPPTFMGAIKTGNDISVTVNIVAN